MLLTCNIRLVVYTEKTWPIAVYDAEHWLAIGGMTVNLSLIEQSLGRATHNYWLRVGVMFDDDSAQPATADEKERATAPQAAELDDSETNDEEGNATEHPPLTPEKVPAQTYPDGKEKPAAGVEGVEREKLYTLAVLSSDVGKWMIPRMDDWVELSAVSRLCFPSRFPCS
jgi:hypothetical protein